MYNFYCFTLYLKSFNIGENRTRSTQTEFKFDPLFNPKYGVNTRILYFVSCN